ARGALRTRATRPRRVRAPDRLGLVPRPERVRDRRPAGLGGNRRGRDRDVPGTGWGARPHGSAAHPTGRPAGGPDPAGGDPERERLRPATPRTVAVLPVLRGMGVRVRRDRRYPAARAVPGVHDG